MKTNKQKTRMESDVRLLRFAADLRGRRMNEIREVAVRACVTVLFTTDVAEDVDPRVVNALQMGQALPPETVSQVEALHVSADEEYLRALEAEGSATLPVLRLFFRARALCALFTLLRMESVEDGMEVLYECALASDSPEQLLSTVLAN